MSERVNLLPLDAADVTIQVDNSFVGGFHLTGGTFEPIIPRTVAELVAIGPTIIVPEHCTGWKTTHELARQLPGAYVQTSVGTRLPFGGV
jgi:7,8-dihydropterin-6-yl-methyl-4-(beta-D-ribofuranosyl)aminobenzene 5'-phosphate synthase